MDRQAIKERVIRVLTHIQETSDYAIPPITDETKPLEDLEGFESQMGVTATGLLAPELGIEIPAGCNIFRNTNQNRPLTVREVVEVLKGLEAAGAGNPAAVSSAAGLGAPDAATAAARDGAVTDAVRVQ